MSSANLTSPSEEMMRNVEHALDTGDTPRDVARTYLRRCDSEEEVFALAAVLRDYGGGADDLVLDQLRTLRNEGTPEGTSPGSRARIVNMVDVAPERVRWLWPSRVPLGKLTILDGDPGVLKSSMALDLAARLSRGAAMPDGTRPNVDGPRGTVLLTAEDGLADTIRPRLDAAAADALRVAALKAVVTEEGERLPTVDDLDAIYEAIESVNAALVVVDPLVAYLGRDVNSYRDQDVRAALAGLAELAEEMGVAVLSIRHLNKSGGGNPLYRGGGSIGLIGAARSGLLVGRDPEEPEGDRRVLASTKCNLAPEPPALAFRPRVVDRTVAIAWEGETDHTARDLLSAPDSREERSAREEAADVLREELRNGPRPVAELKDVADRLGVSWRTVRRAADLIDVKRRKEGFGAAGRWVWSLPSAPRSDRSVPLGEEGGRNPRSGRDVSYPDRGDVPLGEEGGDVRLEGDRYPDKGDVPLEDGPEERGSPEDEDPYLDSRSEKEGAEPLQRDLGAALDGGAP